MIDADKFELLSSYLDGELTPQEKSQVEEWIAQDRDFAQCYQEQLKLQQMWQVPVGNVTSELCFEETWNYIQSRQQQRWLRRGIIALTMAVVSVSSLFVAQRYSWQQAKAKEEPILMALEQPILPMPKELLQE